MDEKQAERVQIAMPALKSGKRTGLARFQLSNPKVLETAHFIDSTRTITTNPASATLAISENKSCHG
jgi:hypothetical protein